MTLVATSPAIVESDDGSTTSEEDEDIAAIELHKNALVQSLGYPGKSLAPPTFGQVSIEHSNDVHFGDKNFYNGPVTIKQVVYANGGAALSSSDNKGKDNLGVENGGEDLNKTDAAVPSETKTADTRCTLIKGFIWLQNETKHRPLEISIFITVVALLVVFVMVMIFLKHPTEAKPVTGSYEPDNTVQPGDYHQDILSTGKKLRLVSRVEWVAQPPTGATTPLKTPVPFVIIHHTATENCSSQAQCVLHVREIQAFHIESRGWYDIGYNFLVGGDGAAYEARGWTTEGAHTLGWNNKSIGIAFIGTFERVKPPKLQLLACQKLIALGLDMGFIQKNYRLLAVRQLAATQSPGKFLFDEIKLWPNWFNGTLNDDL